MLSHATPARGVADQGSLPKNRRYPALWNKAAWVDRDGMRRQVRGSIDKFLARIAG
jgi:hypothetical protein